MVKQLFIAWMLLHLFSARAQNRVHAGAIWPLHLQWKHVAMHESLQLRVDAPGWFTLVAAPSALDQGDGQTTAWLRADPNTPAGRYKINAVLYHKGALKPTQTKEWEVDILPQSKIEVLLLEEHADSVRYWVFNSGNVTIDHQGLSIPIGQGKTMVGRSKTRTLDLHFSSSAKWDTVVSLQLRPYIHWEHRNPRDDSSATTALQGQFYQSIAGSKIMPMECSIRFSNERWSAQVNRQIHRTLGALAYREKTYVYSIGYGWGIPLEFSRAYLAPYVGIQTAEAPFTFKARWSTNYQKATLEWKKATSPQAGFRTQWALHRIEKSMGVSGQFDWTSKALHVHAMVQPGVALADVKVSRSHFLMTLRGTTCAPQNKYSSYARTHLSSSLLWNRGPFTLQQQFTSYVQGQGAWVRQHTGWAAIRMRAFDARLHHFYSSNLELKQNWQLQSNIRSRHLRIGTQLHYNGFQTRVMPSLEFRKSNFSLSSNAEVHPWHGVAFRQAQFRCKLPAGFQCAAFLNTNRAAPTGTIRLTKLLPQGQCAITFRSDGTGSCSWQGGIQKRVGGKSLEGRCVDEQGQPIAGVDIELDGALVRTDENGRFRWKNVAESHIELRIGASSLPFALVPTNGWVQKVDLLSRSTKRDITFHRIQFLNGRFHLKTTSAFSSPIDFLKHKIVLRYASGETITHPVLPDGSFYIGDVKEGEASIELVPKPAGYVQEPFHVVITKEGHHSGLNIDLFVSQEHISFEQL